MFVTLLTCLMNAFQWAGILLSFSTKCTASPGQDGMALMLVLGWMLRWNSARRCMQVHHVLTCIWEKVQLRAHEYYNLWCRNASWTAMPAHGAAQDPAQSPCIFHPAEHDVNFMAFL